MTASTLGGPSDTTASEDVEAVQQSRMADDEGIVSALNNRGMSAPPLPPGISGNILLEHTTGLRKHEKGEPRYRTLTVFAVDPTATRAQGNLTTLKLPYEPLGHGIDGNVFEVDCTAGDGLPLIEPNLDDPFVLIKGGYSPEASDPRFHAQMVYAVCLSTYVHFRAALGRDPSWQFDRRDEKGRNRLLLQPFGAEGMEQAWYDPRRGALVFGYFKPPHHTPTVPNRDGSNVFLSLSNDIITHEVSHALLDGLRPQYLKVSHPDVAAFHEAFGDLVAVFQRFTYREHVTATFQETRGDLAEADALAAIGSEFGMAIQKQPDPIRFLGAADTLQTSPPDYSDASLQAHERGTILGRAVFGAFQEVYRQRSLRFIRGATGGKDRLAATDANADLIGLLVEEVSRIAQQFIRICIRAIDYCPPVDIRFGDYLRALITADRDLVPDDDWGYREAIIRSFGNHGIYGDGTPFMTEDALSWNPPRMPLPQLMNPTFGHQQFRNYSAQECLIAQAQTILSLACQPKLAREFGIITGEDAARGTGYKPPYISSMRTACRAGPDGQVTVDTIAEIVQSKTVMTSGGSYQFFGGSTVIISADGDVRFIVRKRIDDTNRENQQTAYIAGEGNKYWYEKDKKIRPRTDIVARLCGKTT